LQDFNEELEVTNEELQTITEELRLSNEELKQQSDELLTVNRALRESEQKFFKAFYTNPAAMTLNDEKGRWIDVNESFSKLTGYSKSELIGYNAAELDIIDTKNGSIILLNYKKKAQNKIQNLKCKLNLVKNVL
jgi:PAS domain-containing protein